VLEHRGSDDIIWEVVNAFSPDLVLVSFGWNDLATALGAPDDEFEPPGRVRVAIERFLLHYRFFRIMKPYAGRAAVLPPEAVVSHRVPIEDYVDNMKAFVRTAADHQARTVFLTRPHREPVARMREITGNWRGEVPLYNDALRRVGQDEGQLVIDVQAVFEAHHPEHFVDECHFTPEGHQRMAELLYEQLDAAGYLPRPGRTASRPPPP
jgi:lysophospholipase L1-like esterase